MTYAANEQLEFAYPYRAARQPEGGYTITFRDLPEAISQAERNSPNGKRRRKRLKASTRLNAFEHLKTVSGPESAYGFPT